MKLFKILKLLRKYSNFVFLFSIEFRNLVFQLIIHQNILQTISDILLNGIQFKMSLLINQSCQLISCKSKSLLQMTWPQIESIISLIEHSLETSNQFDERPALKFLFQKLCHSSVSANLYQIKYLSWSTLFLCKFTLINDQNLLSKFPNEDQLKKMNSDLKQMLIHISESYCLCLSNEKRNIRQSQIDEICEQPLYFLVKQFNDGDEELAKIINSSGNQVKMYKLASKETIDGVLNEYKKCKSQYAPIPPSGQSLINKINKKKQLFQDENLSEVEKENKEMLIQDDIACLGMLSHLIMDSIELHLSIQQNAQFKSIIPIYLPSIETLIIYCNENKLRCLLSNWMKRVSELLINLS